MNRAVVIRNPPHQKFWCWGKSERWILLTLLLLFPLMSWAGTYEMTVKGLSCPFCVYGVEKKLKKIPGVVSVSTDYKKATVTIETKKDARVDLQAFRQAVIDAGFTPDKIVEKK